MTELNIMPKHRVVLMACTRRKLDFSEPMQAWQVYQGPIWQTFRAAVKFADSGRLDPKRGRQVPPFPLILSARYGFIWDNTLIKPYDHVLTAERGREILADPALLPPKLEGVREIFLAGGRLYRDVMHAGLRKVGYDGPIREPDKPRGVGDIRRALAAFVAASPTIEEYNSWT